MIWLDRHLIFLSGAVHHIFCQDFLWWIWNERLRYALGGWEQGLSARSKSRWKSIALLLVARQLWIIGLVRERHVGANEVKGRDCDSLMGWCEENDTAPESFYSFFINIYPVTIFIGTTNTMTFQWKWGRLR